MTHLRRPTMAMAFLVCLITAVIGAGAASAQYDRDGRYVPSPNGIPTDPNARPIPMDSGTPGGAIGTPSLPRSMFPSAPVVPRLPEPERYSSPVMSRAVVPLSHKQCDDGWNKTTRLTPVEFRRRCALMRRARQTQ